jgi:cytochrome P450
MIITAPVPGERVNLSEINLAGPDLYANGDPHLVWQTLRAEQPLFWQQLPTGLGFWAVTRHADVRRVLAEHETFTSECGTSLSMLGSPDPAAGLMMQATDPPRHRQLRRQFDQPLSAHAVPAYAEQVRPLVREIVTSAREDEVWDAAASFTQLPMAVAAELMGLPKTDINPLLRMSYATLAPLDPHYSSGTEQITVAEAHYAIAEYFLEVIAERRSCPSSDLISFLLTIEIDGRPLTDRELLLNCLSLIVGAVVTTSQAIVATLIALAGERGEGRWPVGASIEAGTEEALRWSSPITHFMRQARRDVELHGEKIHAGQAVTAWIASANRDESVFADPYRLDLRRSPNRHLAFGSGPHRCVGSHLARLMLRLAFQELFTHIECFELTGSPQHLVSNQLAGIASLPIRVKLRPAR